MSTHHKVVKSESGKSALYSQSSENDGLDDQTIYNHTATTDDTDITTQV